MNAIINRLSIDSSSPSLSSYHQYTDKLHLTDYYSQLPKRLKEKLYKKFFLDLDFYYHLYPEEKNSHIILLKIKDNDWYTIIIRQMDYHTSSLSKIIIIYYYYIINETDVHDIHCVCVCVCNPKIRHTHTMYTSVTNENVYVAPSWSTSGSLTKDMSLSILAHSDSGVQFFS